MQLFNLLKSPIFLIISYVQLLHYQSLSWSLNHGLHYRRQLNKKPLSRWDPILKLGENDGTTWRENWKTVLANSNHFRFLNLVNLICEDEFFCMFFSSLPTVVGRRCRHVSRHWWSTFAMKRGASTQLCCSFALSAARASVGYLDVILMRYDLRLFSVVIIDIHLYTFNRCNS